MSSGVETLHIQHTKETAIPTMSSASFTNVMLTVENHGCIYTVCTEGELFYAPIHVDGNINIEEFDIVDFWDPDADTEELEKIQSTLIDMMQCAGLYFRQPVTV
jgi:hypothetical protein